MLINHSREQKKLHLLYRSQLHRMQLETILRESTQPQAGGVFARWRSVSTLLAVLSHFSPTLSRAVKSLKLLGVIVSVARLLRGK